MRVLDAILAAAALGLAAPAFAETVPSEAVELCGATNETAQAREAFCGQAIAEAPRDAGNWMGRAQARIDLNRFAKALVDLERALALDPGAIDALHMRAICRHALEDDAGALADINTVLKARPGDTELLAIRADILVSLKRYDEALADAEGILKQQPDSLVARRRVTQIENAAARARS